jgi:hypothetical protein
MAKEPTIFIQDSIIPSSSETYDFLDTDFYSTSSVHIPFHQLQERKAIFLLIRSQKTYEQNWTQYLEHCIIPNDHGDGKYGSLNMVAGSQLPHFTNRDNLPREREIRTNSNPEQNEADRAPWATSSTRAGLSHNRLQTRYEHGLFCYAINLILHLFTSPCLH